MTKDLVRAIPELLDLDPAQFARDVGVSVDDLAKWKGDLSGVSLDVKKRVVAELSRRKTTPIKVFCLPFQEIGFKIVRSEEYDKLMRTGEAAWENYQIEMRYACLAHANLPDLELAVESGHGFGLSETSLGSIVVLPGHFALGEWRACRQLLRSILDRQLTGLAAKKAWTAGAPGANKASAKWVQARHGESKKERRAKQTETAGIMAELQANADKGDPTAQYNFGLCLIRGRWENQKIAADEEQGRKWLSRAAQQSGTAAALARKALEKLDDGESL